MDPYRAYNFTVRVSGIDDGQFNFTECSGLQASVANQEYREGGQEPLVRQIPTGVSYQPVTLKYGVTSSQTLWNWLTQATTGQVERKNVTIAMLNTDGQTIAAEWTLLNAWPQAWESTELDPGSSELAIASLSLVFDQLQPGK
ncbi:MAG: phage tail protein [Ardenticatenales bacterium]|nr:phage tail protein [Ardenticatenales bacterium]